MTSRAAGRHRRRLSAQRPQSLLLLEYSGGDGPRGVYLNSGIVPNGSRLFSPGLAGVGTRRGTDTQPGSGTEQGTATRRGTGTEQGTATRRGTGTEQGTATRRGTGTEQGTATRRGTGTEQGTATRRGTGTSRRTDTRPAGGRRAIRAALVRDRRAFAIALSATLAGVTAAATFGIIAPLHSTWMAGGRPGAAGSRPPQASAPWSAAPLGSPSGQATVRNPSGPATPPSRPRRTGRARPSARPPGQAPTPRTGPTASTVPGTSTGTSTGAAASTRTRTSAAARSSSGTARPESKVVVRYLVDSQLLGEFQGQVQVVNDSTQPIGNWQIVIALPDDTVTAVQNAGGLISHGILLLQPADVAEVVPPSGTLNVFFVAEGTETTPAACAFNGIACA